MTDRYPIFERRPGEKTTNKDDEYYTNYGDNIVNEEQDNNMI